jgi:hypothetical protein
MLLTGAASSLIMPMVAPGITVLNVSNYLEWLPSARLEDPMCQLSTARPLPLGRQVERTHHSGLITFVSGLIGPEWFERKFLRERSRIY